MGAKKKPKQPEKPYHHGELRDALMKEALQMIAEEGTGALTLRELARRVGVTHAAPYRHFENKDALMAAVAEEGFRALTSEMQAMIAAEKDPAMRFAASGRGYVKFAVAHPGHVRVMFGVKRGLMASFPTLVEAASQAFNILLQGVVACQERGQIRTADSMLTAVHCWSMVHGLSLLIIDEQLGWLGVDTNDVDKLAQTALDLLGDGMKPR